VYVRISTAGRELPGEQIAHVPAPRLALDRALHREKVIFDVERLGREDREAPHEDVAHLVGRASDGRGRCDNLRAHLGLPDLPRAEIVDGGLVQTDHRSEGPADQVELVLDDEVRRAHTAHRL
jgi:hypothetical protein